MYYFTQTQRNLIDQTASDPNPPGGNALANMYDLIYSMIQQPDTFGNMADGNVIAWFGAAAQTNRGTGGASDFIRSYTQSQLEIRSGNPLPDVSSTLQAASNAIAEAVRDDIFDSDVTINGVTYFALPTANEIGEKDAIKTLESLSGFSSSPGIWSGNPLYIGLGDGSFWHSTILETAGDTYDLLVAVQSFWIAGIDSLANVGDLVSLWYGQGSVGRSEALAQVTASLAATNSFFEDAYGFFGENGIAGLFGDQIVVGSEGYDFSLDEQLGLSATTFIHGGSGNDLLVGSLGVDTLDGGTDEDEANFYMVSGGMAGGLHAAIYNLDSSARFSALVESEDVKSALFNIESLYLGRHDDVLDVVSLDASTTALTDVYGGENGSLGDKIDLSYVTMAAATVNLEANTLRLSGSQVVLNVYDFEAVIGTTHNDVITGDDNANYMNGHFGADSLFGGGGDDFIFFDAADGDNVNGGGGRDVAVALGQAGVTLDMLNQGLEVVVGGSGADTISVGTAEDMLFAAGGGGDDTFIVGFDPEMDGPRVMWGGAGADTFVFEEGMGGGIAVVQINGLTEEMFANMTVEDLGLGGLNLGALRAIVINPDGSDRFELGGELFSASEMPDGVEWRSFSSPSLADLIGRPLAVSGGYESNYEFKATLFVERDEFENVLSITEYTGRWLSDGSEEFYFYEYDPNEQGEQDEAEAFIEARAIEPVFRMTDLETNPYYGPWYSSFYVVGGNFTGSSLHDNGTLTASVDDPGTTPFDWLLVA